ncbi:HAD family hydrolase [Lacticaseibacillus absianus]|uniref:HAD family hydrolase n=1 Tax=Lacticaseibacillus absianus TaxID=2729623 RepID=UPI001FEA3417|nr:HAD family hydrolase [Lacticaseibacillus absianus]
MNTFIFDIDGTLIDSVTMYLAGLQRTMRRHGQDYTQDQLRFSNGIPSSDTMTRLGFTEDAVDAAIREWTEDSLAFAATVDWFPGMQDTLANLRAGGAKLGIVTSKNADQYALDVTRFGFATAVDTAVVAHDAPRNKPFGDPIELAMTRLGSDPHRTVYVGDTRTDALAAQAAGVPFALCTWTTPHLDEPVAYPLQRPTDLLALL